LTAPDISSKSRKTLSSSSTVTTVIALPVSI
jgi:hypothetical protein